MEQTSHHEPKPENNNDGGGVISNDGLGMIRDQDDVKHTSQKMKSNLHHNDGDQPSQSKRHKRIRDDDTTCKEKKQKRKSKRAPSSLSLSGNDSEDIGRTERRPNENKSCTTAIIPPAALTVQKVQNEHLHILAPMVGASELPFRFLCRKYGAQLCYTPMMSSQSFATSSDYRKEYFGKTNSERVHFADHPIYAHVYANTVSDFVAAAQQALAMDCDGIDLNLGCPQRTAYIGHYGSYLCTNDTKSHQHISNMLTAAAQAIQRNIPVTAKIRLLHATDFQPTLDLCRTLYNHGTGASWIAIHARPRASWERTGPSARDGPAMLSQVTSIVQAMRQENAKASSDECGLRIVTNGNTITYNDVVNNLQSTMADGIMSAEGLLDNPALYLPRLVNTNNRSAKGSKNHKVKTSVTVWTLKEDYRYKYHDYQPIKGLVTASGATAIENSGHHESDRGSDANVVKIQSIQEKMHKVEAKLQILSKKQSPSPKKQQRYRNKQQKLQQQLQKQLQVGSSDTASPGLDLSSTKSDNGRLNEDPHIELRTVTVQSLLDIASDKLLLGMEYLDWATIYPTTIRTIVFHIRRMCKAELVQYQLLQPCLNATTIDTIRDILNRIIQYRINPDTFTYDSQRAQEEKEALARQKYEEGKRKAFEERMIRKAKRERKDDLFFYLNIGAALPTRSEMEYYRTLDRDTLIPIWKQHHSQHCISYHMDPHQCPRGRACAFLHVDTTTKTALQETDECAG